MLVTIILGRHGQTTDNINQVISGGSSNPPLTDVGVEEAKKLGEIFATRHADFDAETVYCADLQRTERTAQLAFAGKEITIEPNPAFREIDHGPSEGMPAGERAKVWKEFVSAKIAGQEEQIDPFFKWKVTPFEGAETFQKLWKRASRALVQIARDNPEKRKLIVITSNAFIQVLMMHSLIREGKLQPEPVEVGNGKPPQMLYPLFFEKSLLRNCAVAEFTCDPDAEDELDQVRFIRLEEPV